MTRAATIRIALAFAALAVAGQAQAGQDVPPPRDITPVPSFLSAAPRFDRDAARGAWRETPAVMQGWSSDRHVPVVGLDRMTACEARARIGAMAADDGWADDADDFADAADFDDEDFLPAWGR